jgi:hypothetical protein
VSSCLRSRDPGVRQLHWFETNLKQNGPSEPRTNGSRVPHRKCGSRYCNATSLTFPISGPFRSRGTQLPSSPSRGVLFIAKRTGGAVARSSGGLSRFRCPVDAKAHRTLPLSRRSGLVFEATMPGGFPTEGGPASVVRLEAEAINRGATTPIWALSRGRKYPGARSNGRLETS